MSGNQKKNTGGGGNNTCVAPPALSTDYFACRQQRGPGFYIFFNNNLGGGPPETATTGTYERLKAGIQQVVNKDWPIQFVSNNQADWTSAIREVQNAGGRGAGQQEGAMPYACGDVIGPGFFSGPKMKHTINIIILFVFERIPQDTGNGPAKMVKEKGGDNYTTYGFAVLRDLLEANTIKFRIGGEGGIEGGGEYFDSLSLETKTNGSRNPSYIKNENCLYIEGVCASTVGARGRGKDLMDLTHLLAFYSRYTGCKLSSLTYVIQMYFNKYSYRFRKGCDADPAEFFQLNNTVPRLPRLKGDEDVDDAVVETMGSVWSQFVEQLTTGGFNAEVSSMLWKTLGSLRNFWRVMTDDEGDEIEVMRKAPLWEKSGMLDQGFKMYLCFHNDPTMGIPTANPTPATNLIIDNYRREQGLADSRKAARKSAVASSAMLQGKPKLTSGHKSLNMGGRRRKRKKKKTKRRRRTRSKRKKTRGRRRRRKRTRRRRRTHRRRR